MTERPDKAQKSSQGLRGWRNLLGYVRLLKHHRRDLILVNLLMVVSTGVSLAIPVLAGRYVDALTGGPSSLHAPLLVLLGVLLLIQLVTTYFNTVVSTRFGLQYVTMLRKRLMQHLLELPSLFFTHHKAGDLSSRMTGDVGSIQHMMTSGIVSLGRAAITLVGAVALMFLQNVRLTLVILALVPTTILLVRLFGNRMQRLSRRMFKELGQISSHVQEISGAIRLIKVYNSQEHEGARFDGMLERYLDDGVRRGKIAAALESGAQMLLWMCLITIVVYGFWLTSRQQTSPGDLVSFFLLAYRVAFPMSMLTSLYSSAQGAIAAADRLAEIFSVGPERSLAPTLRPQPPCRGSISLENVTFSYAEKPVLENISMQIEAGEWVGIVGPSGAGKTTLTSLILRLFDPQSGRLLLDGRPFADFDLTFLRGQMAYVSQEPILYNMSIGENIRFGLDDTGLEDVRLAARKAGALEFIESLPEKFDTMCGERGVRLSGGQRQRITLARAFLRNPRILVLDEPTSALDAKSEEDIRTALDALMRDRTAIVIAHRLSLVRNLNRVFVLCEGRLVEVGSHAELLSRQGLYSTLYRLQHGP